MASVSLPELQREMVRVSRLLHDHEWVANHEGNLTALAGDGHVLATPTAMSKGDVREGDLLLVDRSGRKIHGSRRPFSELSMHLAVYKGRPDVGAIVHAHPPASTAFAVAGRPVDAAFLPEFVVSIGGKVPLVPFALPGSETLNNSLVPFLEPFDVVLLQNHGVLAWGPDLSTALLRVEHCESAARILLSAGPLGGPKPLTDEVVRQLLDARTRAGLGPQGRAASGK
jgi:L-fuculose-phosphate aldolase